MSAQDARHGLDWARASHEAWADFERHSGLLCAPSAKPEKGREAMKRVYRAKRVVYRVRWRHGHWIVLEGKLVIHAAVTQLWALRWACADLSGAWLDLSQLGQVVVHGKNGRIRFERTFGRDPRRTKG